MSYSLTGPKFSETFQTLPEARKAGMLLAARAGLAMVTWSEDSPSNLVTASGCTTNYFIEEMS